VTRQSVLLQISDTHIGAPADERDPAVALAAVVNAVAEIGVAPDAVLLSGDLAHSGKDDEYQLVAELVTRLEAPVCVLPGNHDDRAALRRRFGLPGGVSDPVLYAADVGEMRLIVLDGVQPGADHGALDVSRLTWLDRELFACGDQTIILATHHPPIAIGNSAWDAIGLPVADRRALAEIIGGHPRIGRIVCGHLHRALVAEFVGRPVFVAPSTYLQAQLDLGPAGGIALSAAQPPGFALHVLKGGELTSHVELVV